MEIVIILSNIFYFAAASFLSHMKNEVWGISISFNRVNSSEHNDSIAKYFFAEKKLS